MDDYDRLILEVAKLGAKTDKATDEVRRFRRDFMFVFLLMPIVGFVLWFAYTIIKG